MSTPQRPMARTSNGCRVLNVSPSEDVGDSTRIDCARVTRRCQYFVLTFSHSNFWAPPWYRGQALEATRQSVRTNATGQLAVTAETAAGGPGPEYPRCGVPVARCLITWLQGRAECHGSTPSTACRQVNTGQLRTLKTFDDDFRWACATASESRTHPSPT